MSTGEARHPLHWLPNALTVGRCLLVPVVIFCIVTPENAYASEAKLLYALALIGFLLCTVTDFFDGYFARKFKVTSDFGRMLDPIADKILVAGTLIALCAMMFEKSPAILIPSLVIIFRDFAVSGVREFAANSNRVLAPTKLAKWKTATEMLAIILYLAMLVSLTYGMPTDVKLSDTNEVFLKYASLLNNLAFWVLGIAAALSAYTGFHYFREAFKKT